MAPHLLRAQSAYKDIRIHSLHYTHTHVTHTTNTCISIYTEIHRSQEKETERDFWNGGVGRANRQEDCWQPGGHLLVISLIIVVIVEATRLWAKVCWPLGDARGVCKLRQGIEHVYTRARVSHIHSHCSLGKSRQVLGPPRPGLVNEQNSAKAMLISNSKFLQHIASPIPPSQSITMAVLCHQLRWLFPLHTKYITVNDAVKSFWYMHQVMVQQESYFDIRKHTHTHTCTHTLSLSHTHKQNKGLLPS